MKRLVIPGLALLVVLALLYWGNRIVERTLDAELPQLLSRELGIPVALEPTRARIASLTVRSPKLVMGDPSSPALVATRVAVSLDWSDLLRGEIRLRRGSGGTLMVNPSLWPGNDDPWPADYHFLDPYLPDYLAVDSASYVDGSGDSYTFSEAAWRRQEPGALLSWRDQSGDQEVSIKALLHSLDALLGLAGVKLHLTAAVAGRAHSTVKVAADLEPANPSGYRLTADIEGGGMTADIVTGNDHAWVLPDQSATTVNQFDIEQFQALLASYRGNTGGDEPEALLASRLPRLSLPKHKGHVTIGEIRWQDEVSTNSVIDFVTGPQGVAVPMLSSRGPEGILHGQVNISSSDSGWLVALTADIQTAESDKSLATAYLDADWFWRQGNGKVTGQGETWGALLNSLQGDITLTGSHHGAAITPVTISARLDNRPGEFALDSIEIEVGKGRVTGSAALSGDMQKRLTGKIRAEQLDLNFLLPPPDPVAPPGMELPTYIEILPGVDLDWQLDISKLTVSGFDIAQASIGFVRAPDRATLSAHSSGADGGSVDLQLDASIFPDKPSELTVRTDFARFPIAQLFGQVPLHLDSRTSGNITFRSQGKGLQQIFKALKGKAELSIDLRPDHDWQRPALPQEQFRVSGEAAPVLDDSRITGLRISELALDSALQNVTGSLSLAAGRKPWLEADLTSDKLDLDQLAKLKPTDAGDGPESGSLDTLRQLGVSRLTLHARSLRVSKLPLSELALRVTTAPDSVSVQQLDFSLEQGRLASKGDMHWLKDEASLSLDARLTDLRLDKFLPDVPATASVPLSGTVTLSSTGTTFGSLLADLKGDIQLATSPDRDNTVSGTGGEIDMTARQTADGMHAEIRRLKWEGSDLAGSVQYQRTTPPLLEVEISGGSLSLLPWEQEETDEKKDASKEKDSSVVTRTARASADLIGDVVMAPLRLISGPREAEPGEKLFTTTPLPFDWLAKYQARIKGRLDTLTSREGNASDLTFSASLVTGQLAVEASAGTLNQGSASASLAIDMSQQPATVALSGTFSNLRGELAKVGFPRSGYFDVTSRGQSQAELAANVDGLVYLELGKGPIDYSKMMLLTADVASNVFETLIPGVDKTQPQLECAVTLGVFKDGIGSTPYGYAARTNQANLVGRIEIDLKKELLHLNFSSSSRKGVGFSIGNVFSNTVEVEGPLTDPKVIPNATGLLWRSWAAVMTGGLSVVGESVLKRALASEDPCVSVQKHIRKNICGTTQPAASSTLVCPPV